MALAPLVLAGHAFAAETGPGKPSEIIFLAQIILLLLCGRLLGEAMQRIGQPAVMGQLIAGILLGPSVFGMIAPDLQQTVFPESGAQKSMIDAVAQFGILLMLLLTGMETDLSVVRKAKRAAFTVSFAGIIIPFALGFALGEMMPASLVPDPDRRLITALFLGTALSISSVKIVAMVVREVGFMRRLVGQIIVASAIVDDTIGWIIMAITFGLARHGGIDLVTAGQSVIGTALFLAASFTFGPRLVFLLIRWTNDKFVMELPVITMILVFTGVMAMITHAIGVHTILGAFVAGILVGQSPILTKHIDGQLRGLIVALFMPIFFGLAGQHTDLAALANPSMLLLSLGMIVIASAGKFAGAFIGGRLGDLTMRESLALACGMNARGSTEVIVATLGLSMGVLNEALFTSIVVMAIITTMAMPPMLRWALARVPLRPDEKDRIEREASEARGFFGHLERVLLTVDDSPSGHLASRLVGLMTITRRIVTTVLPAGMPDSMIPLKAEAAVKAAGEQVRGPDAATTASLLDVEIPRQDTSIEQVMSEQAKKGYDFLVLGMEPVHEKGRFSERLARVVEQFDGPFAIVHADATQSRSWDAPPRDILVPVSGTSSARHGAELAIALARGGHSTVTALYAESKSRGRAARHRPRWTAEDNRDAVLREIVLLGEQQGVFVKPVALRGAPEDAILKQLKSGRHDLIVMGVRRRPGETLSFGDAAEVIAARSTHPVVFVASEG